MRWRQFEGKRSANFAKTRTEQKVAIDHVKVSNLKNETIKCLEYLKARYNKAPNMIIKTAPNIIFSDKGLSGFKKKRDLNGVVSVLVKWC